MGLVLKVGIGELVSESVVLRLMFALDGASPTILLAIEPVELLVFGRASFVDASSADALGMPSASTVVYY
jgi:hypothetical protein